jgi:hypothetical protein
VFHHPHHIKLLRLYKILKEVRFVNIMPLQSCFLIRQSATPLCADRVQNGDTFGENYYVRNDNTYFDGAISTGRHWIHLCGAGM